MGEMSPAAFVEALTLGPALPIHPSPGLAPSLEQGLGFLMQQWRAWGWAVMCRAQGPGLAVETKHMEDEGGIRLVAAWGVLSSLYSSNCLLNGTIYIFTPRGKPNKAWIHHLQRQMNFQRSLDKKRGPRGPVGSSSCRSLSPGEYAERFTPSPSERPQPQVTAQLGSADPAGQHLSPLPRP